MYFLIEVLYLIIIIYHNYFSINISEQGRRPDIKRIYDSLHMSTLIPLKYNGVDGRIYDVGLSYLYG